MALCDFIITQDIAGYDCETPPIKGAEAMGLLLNRASLSGNPARTGFTLDFQDVLICDNHAYKVYQSGKTPFTGSQQEMAEGTYQNTITNTVQFVVLKQDEDWAQQLFALMNGEFVAFLQNKNGTYQVYGAETGLRCTGAVRELYNDDTLAGWQLTFVEEGAAFGNLFITKSTWDMLQVGEECEP